MLNIPYFSHLMRSVLQKIVQSLKSIKYRKGQEVTFESFDSFRNDIMMQKGGNKDV